MSHYTERYGSSGRVNIYKNGKVINLHNTSKVLQSIKQFLRSVFLPQGYPHSVSQDYLQYQLWDTLQAFSSSITGALATQAVLKGVGVGDSEATVMAATITWLLKDGTGMVGRILFAWMKGSNLDSDSKKWRMYADILNDSAILLDIISPFFPSIFTTIVCISGVFRSIVGVAGGATRAAITQHQAINNNMADVAAKDGSQETLVNLAGLLVSLLVIPIVTTHSLSTWTFFSIFTFIHLYANFKAVTCLVIDTFNQSRFSIVVHEYVLNGYCPLVKEANKREPVIFGLPSVCDIHLGCSYIQLLSNKTGSSSVIPPLHLHNEAYILNLDLKKREVRICLRHNAGVEDQLRAVYHAELIKLTLQTTPHHTFRGPYEGMCHHSNLLLNSTTKDVQELISHTHRLMIDTWSSFKECMLNAGWKMEYVMLGADEWRLWVED